MTPLQYYLGQLTNYDDTELDGPGPILAKFDAIAAVGGDPKETALRQAGFIRECIRTQPLAFFKELRDQRPILKTPMITLVSRQRDVEEILHRETIFSVRPYVPHMQGVIGPFILSLDLTPEYDHDVSAMRLAVRRDDLDRVKSTVSAHANRIVAELKTAESFDIIGTLTRVVPVRLAADYYGITGASEADMMRWARACFHEFFVNLDNDPAVRAAAEAAGDAFKAHLRDLIEQRRGGEGDTVADRLLEMQRAGPGTGFDDEGIVRTLMGLVVGMVETTSQAAAQALTLLFQQPEALAKAQSAARADDDATLAEIVFEALRFWPVNPLVVRLTTQPYRLAAGEPHETEIEAGTLVFNLTWSAMFDRRVVEAPGAFRTPRPPHVYQHFSTGAHTCFGKHISEVQVPQILKPLLALEGLKPAGDPEYAGPFPDRLEVTHRS